VNVSLPATRCRRTPTPFAHKGFTLLELLVVMTLLSLLMTGLISAMRTMAQTETKIDQRFDRLDDLRTSHAFLAQTLGRLSAVRTDDPAKPGKSLSVFSATTDSLTWVGTLPARPNVGGRHFFQLTVESADLGDALVLRVAPGNVDLALPDWSVAERHVLMSGVAKLTIQAQGRPTQGHEKASVWPQGWQDGWPITDLLPEQLRLTFQDASQTDTVQWTFELHALPQSDSTINVVSAGGG